MNELERAVSSRHPAAICEKAEPARLTVLQQEIDRADQLHSHALRIRNSLEAMNERLSGLIQERNMGLSEGSKDSNQGNLNRLRLVHDWLETVLNEIEGEVSRLQELV